MSSSFKLNMQLRSHLGTSASGRLRRSDNGVTVSLYGKDQKPLNLSVDHSSLMQVLQNDQFSPSSIITVTVGDNSYPAIFKKLHRDPVKPKVLDAELLRIHENKPMHVSVPLQFEGGSIAPGIKLGGGRLSYQLTSIDVQCLPKDLPQSIRIDISKLNLNEIITVSQLSLPENVVLTDTTDRVIVSMIAPRGQSSTAEKPVSAE